MNAFLRLIFVLLSPLVHHSSCLRRMMEATDDTIELSPLPSSFPAPNASPAVDDPTEPPRIQFQEEPMASRMTLVSFSSTLTASDLPGAGRTLGNVISKGGRKLEKAWARVNRSRTRRRGQASTPTQAPSSSTPDGSAASSQIIHSAQAGPSRSLPSSSGVPTEAEAESDCTSEYTYTDHSSNWTMSNLPGTGRIIGQYYSRGGRVLERVFGRMAAKSGKGPDAIAERMYRRAGDDFFLDFTDAGKDPIFAWDRWDWDKEMATLLRYATRQVSVA